MKFPLSQICLLTLFLIFLAIKQQNENIWGKKTYNTDEELNIHNTPETHKIKDKQPNWKNEQKLQIDTSWKGKSKWLRNILKKLFKHTMVKKR